MFTLAEFNSLLPLWYVWFVSFGLGVVVGSFLNVYIYRLHTGKSLGGSSHCLSCGTPLRWFELVPLLSYLMLRGRCRTCKSCISPRYFVVELLTGLLFVLAFQTASSWFELLPLLVLLAILVVITVYDINHLIIPDSLTVVALLCVVGLLGLQVANGYALESVVVDVAAAVGGASFFLLLWFISKGTWLGFGDVKLAFPLGLLVGAPYVFSFVVASFWIGAAVSIGLLLIQQIPRRGKPSLHSHRGQLTMKSAVPFAPFLIAGCLAVYFTHFNVLTLFTF